MNMLDVQDILGYPFKVKKVKKCLEFRRSLWRTALRRGDRAVLQNINKGDYDD
jgi:hypothetical protein